MLIGINPVVISLGPVAVRWFGLLALLGLGVAIGGSMRELDRERIGRKLALDALAWGLPVGLLTARGVHVLAQWEFYLTNASELWQLNVDGLSLWGGLVGGGLVIVARLGRDPSRCRRILDAIVPYAALGIAIGRVGEFLDGSGQGVPSSLPWATAYTNPLAATPDFGVPRHPAQLYDGVVALALFGLLWLVPRSLPAGSRAAAFLMSYGLARLALGAVCLDPAFLFGLQIEEILAIGAVLYGTAFGGAPLAGEAVRHLRRRVPADAAGAQPESARKEDSLAA